MTGQSHILQGYLDIVRWLCEHGDAASNVDGVRGIDIKSKGGWTPLSAFSIHMPMHLLFADSRRLCQ